MKINAKLRARIQKMDKAREYWFQHTFMVAPFPEKSTGTKIMGIKITELYKIKINRYSKISDLIMASVACWTSMSKRNVKLVSR